MNFETKAEPIISVKGLCKIYNDFIAVKEVSFDVYEGEIFGLLGPNGAGKTTTLEIIETLRKKTSGEIIVDGYDVDTEAKSIRQIIGIQLQSSGFYPDLNLVETIKMFACMYGVKVKPLEILDMVDLTDKAKSKFDKLSGGQKQRFSICTTLINKPKIVFLDEPTTGLDPQARRSLWDLIKEVRNHGTTVVLTTHYMDEAEELCDRIAIVDQGEILRLDTPNNLIDNLLAKGFSKPKHSKDANLEDVFLNLTGKALRE
jgi:ABC-2 type transport system ATP-binding protein